MTLTSHRSSPRAPKLHLSRWCAMAHLEAPGGREVLDAQPAGAVPQVVVRWVYHRLGPGRRAEGPDPGGDDEGLHPVRNRWGHLRSRQSGHVTCTGCGQVVVSEAELVAPVHAQSWWRAPGQNSGGSTERGPERDRYSATRRPRDGSQVDRPQPGSSIAWDGQCLAGGSPASASFRK